MNLTKLSSLKSLDILSDLKPLQYKRASILKSYLNEIDLILYSTNLCLFSMRILRNEIEVKNRDVVLKMTTNEIGKLHNILSKKDILLHSDYTKEDTKKFFKKVGLKSKYLK